MRKKAERKIRQAAAMLGEADVYRIDRVRENTDLIRKVFDKTLLDMARVGAVELIDHDASGMVPAEAANLIRRGDRVYVQFRVTDPPFEAEKAETPEPETINIIIRGVDRWLWRRFYRLCTEKGGRRPAEKIKEWIRDYIKAADDRH
jgi:hypothetical protein